jgi:hypothetical protein
VGISEMVVPSLHEDKNYNPFLLIKGVYNPK